MTNDPPGPMRTKVRIRAGHRCERCLVPTPAGHLHHRRSRSVRDQHTHCPCNMTWLCPTCHVWVHAHPFVAKGDGWIVSRNQPNPTAVPVHNPREDRILTCAGGFILRFSPTEELEQP